jgi:LacI family transcriptional regulator
MESRESRRQRGAPTILDVAKHAGVSAMTVSRVFNDEQSVRPATRDKVRKAIAALNYAPSAAARALAGAMKCGSACFSRTLPTPSSPNC